MTMVTLGISSVEDAKTRMLAAFQGEAQGAFIGFATAELLWKVITPKRWAVLRAMTGTAPIAIREVARRVGRDVKSVHGDIQALAKAGVLDRTENGGGVFPYDETVAAPSLILSHPVYEVLPIRRSNHRFLVSWPLENPVLFRQLR